MNITTKINQTTGKGIVDLAIVASVYVGKDGVCCCGCAGTHTYASQHTEFAGKERGYAVDDSSEVDDVVVARAVATINRVGAEWDGNIATAVVGRKIYIAYLVTTKPKAKTKVPAKPANKFAD